MGDVFEVGALVLAKAVDAAAVLMIGLAAARAVWQAIWLLLRPDGSRETGQIRLSLGRWLVLALEFLVAADILRTAVAPSWADIGKLAATIVIRTVLNYFLQQDIAQAGQADGPRPAEG